MMLGFVLLGICVGVVSFAGALVSGAGLVMALGIYVLASLAGMTLCLGLMVLRHRQTQDGTEAAKLSFATQA